MQARPHQPQHQRTVPLPAAPAQRQIIDSSSFNARRQENFGENTRARENTRQSFEERSYTRGGSAVPEVSFGGLNSKSRVLRSQHTVSHLLRQSDTARQGIEDELADKEKFKQEVTVVKKRVYSLGRRTLNPNSKGMRMWDLIVIAALVVTAIITPFEVSFFISAVYSGAANFTFNRLIDSVFLVDIVITFFLPFRQSPQKGGMMIYDNRSIAINYFRTWFFLDLFTCLPLDLIFTGIVALSGWEIEANLFRLLRVLRILKLMRMLRASRIISRWQDHVGLSFATMSLISFSCLTCLLAHWLACLWGFMGIRGEEEWTGYASGLTWIQKARVPDSASPYDLYIMSLYVALNTIFGGSCEIQAGNYVEFAIQATMLLIGSSVWAYVIGSACGIIATLDPAKIEFRQTMDQLNYFCKEHVAPPELSVRMRSYFRNTLHVIRSRRSSSGFVNPRRARQPFREWAVTLLSP